MNGERISFFGPDRQHVGFRVFIFLMKPNAQLREAHLSDLPYLYEICLKTGAAGDDATGLFGDPWMLGQYYAAPYLIKDRDYCFVATQREIPLGYILATDDTLGFDEWMESYWLPTLRARYPKTNAEGTTVSEQERGLIAKIHESHGTVPVAPWLSKYPAHLHIDLLPALQGQGCGKRLMETLLSRLIARSCPGVHLGVSAENTRAIAFYEKLGFQKLETLPWGLFLGMTLS